MISKKFYINVVVRILLILISCICIIPFLQKEEKLFTILSLIVLLVLQIRFLLNYINRFNREIATFFSALKTNDASFAFHDKTFPYINQEFRKNIEYIRTQLFNITELRQIQQSYFKSVIENAQTGIISINETGNIDLINKSALELLNTNSISHISAVENIHPNFYHFIYNCNPGDEKSIIIKGKTKAIPISIKVSEFKIKKEKLKLISFQNIETELKEKELESWHKLIRVLTHEINNTISPITSLSNSLEKLFRNTQNEIISKEELTDKTLGKTSEGLHIITQRGEGLVEFVNNYRSISSLKKMTFEPFKIAELFYNLELLLKKKLEENKVKLSINILPIDLELNADKKYIEQIFINLIKNSIDAIENESGEINLNAFKTEHGKIILEIKDNGLGIPDEILEQIFVPFFTTKKQGSGIGLSLAQQIMRLHGGNISVQSELKKGTTFTLTF